MLKIILPLFAFISSSLVHAVEPDPCAPTRNLTPSYLSCQKGDLTYNVTIHTLASPVTPECPYERHVEVQSATVEIGTWEGLTHNRVGELKLNPGYFEYKLGDFFKSKILKLDLKKCISPVHGGVSTGN